MPKSTQAPGDSEPLAAAQPMTGGSAPGNGADDGRERRPALERRVDQRVGEERRAGDRGADQVDAEGQDQQPAGRHRGRKYERFARLEPAIRHGARRVRFIRRSGPRSITWLNADAPPATSAVPASVSSRRDAFAVSPSAMT